MSHICIYGTFEGMPEFSPEIGHFIRAEFQKCTECNKSRYFDNLDCLIITQDEYQKLREGKKVDD